MAQLKPCCGHAPNVMVLGSSMSIACVVCKASVEASGYALASELWNQSVDYRHGPADAPWSPSLRYGKPAPADSVRNDDAERARIASDKEWSFSMTPGFGIRADEYTVNGKKASREQYLLAMLDAKTAEADKLRAEVARLKDESAPTFQGGTACHWYGVYRREVAGATKLLKESDRLKALCDEGARKIAELRQERDAARGFSIGTSAAFDDLRGKLTDAEQAHQRTICELEEAKRHVKNVTRAHEITAASMSDVIEERNAATSARDYWHEAHDRLLSNVQGALKDAAL